MRNPPLWDRMRRQNNPGILLGGLLLVAGYLTLVTVLLNAFHPPIRKVVSRPLLPPSSAAIKTTPLAPSLITVKSLTLPAARPNTLLAKSRRVASVANWNLHTRAGIQPYQDYFWAGKEKVFFFRTNNKIARLLCSHDLITDKETQYRKVSKMWSDDGWYKQDIDISPDGRWVRGKFRQQ